MSHAVQIHEGGIKYIDLPYLTEEIILLHFPDSITTFLAAKLERKLQFIESGQTIEFHTSILSCTKQGIVLLDSGEVYIITIDTGTLIIQKIPVLFPEGTCITKISSNERFSVAVSQDSDVFVWGDYCPPFSDSFKFPCLIGKIGERVQILCVACSPKRILIGTNQGIYGYGEIPEIPFIDNDKRPDQFKKNSDITGAIQISCSDSAIYLVLAESPNRVEIYSDSFNGFKELESPIRQIQAVRDCAALALLENGEIFTWFLPVSDKAVTDIVGFSCDSETFLFLKQGPCPNALAKAQDGSKLFRPGNLPAKNPREAYKHRIEVARLLESQRNRPIEASNDLVTDKWDIILSQLIPRTREFQDFLTDQHNSPFIDDLLFKEVITLWSDSGLSPKSRYILWPLSITNQFSGDLSPEIYESLKHNKTHLQKSKVFLDVDRTFPHLTLLSNDTADNSFRTELISLLIAYESLCPECGYVQGMSFVASTLLMHLNPFNAFRVFLGILEWPIIQKLYLMDMCSVVRVFVYIERVLVKNGGYEIIMHFRSVKLEIHLFLLEWLLTIFTKSTVNQSEIPRLLDDILLNGEKHLIKFTVAVLLLLQQEFLGLPFDETVEVLKTGPKKLTARQILNKTVIMDDEEYMQFHRNLVA
jgi:Rab-GTPase-TBC domain